MSITLIIFVVYTCFTGAHLWSMGLAALALLASLLVFLLAPLKRLELQAAVASGLLLLVGAFMLLKPSSLHFELETLGLLIAVGGLCATGCWIFLRPTATKETPVISLCYVCVGLGLLLMAHKRIGEMTSVSFEGFGIKAAAEKAKDDAATITRVLAEVDKQAKSIAQVSTMAEDARSQAKALEAKNQMAEQKLAELDTAIRNSAKELSRLTRTADYVERVSRALSDDRRAYDELRSMAANSADPSSVDAQNVVTQILLAHSQGFSTAGYKVPWQEGVNPMALTADQLAEGYRQADQRSDLFSKLGLIEFITSRSDIPKPVRAQLLLSIMLHDGSLKAVEHAGRRFPEVTGCPPMAPIDVDAFSAWWQKNKDTIH